MNQNEIIPKIQAKIKKIEDQRPYKIVGKSETYSDYNQGWADACDILREEILLLFPAWREFQKVLNDNRNVGSDPAPRTNG